MELTNLVDVAVGLTLVYLGASLFVTITNEYIAQVLNRRGRQLAGDLQALIDDTKTVERLKTSPALRPFFERGPKLFGQGAKPNSYVDPHVLARLLIGGLRVGQQEVSKMSEIIAAIDSLADSKLKAQLQTLSRSVSDNVDEFVKSVAAWADRSLSMLGEVYKSRTQVISFIVGLGVAVAFNVDTLAVTEHLYRDKEARNATAEAAVQLVQSTSSTTYEKCMAMSDAERRTQPSCAGLVSLADGLRHRDNAFGKLPIGWPSRGLDGPGVVGPWVTRPVGWLLSALAISLGAAFWFDFLSRLVNVRHGMRKPDVAENG
jgi:hypothetical protein